MYWKSTQHPVAEASQSALSHWLLGDFHRWQPDKNGENTLTLGLHRMRARSGTPAMHSGVHRCPPTPTSCVLECGAVPDCCSHETNEVLRQLKNSHMIV